MSMLPKILLSSICLYLCDSNVKANTMCNEKALRETIDVFGNAFVTADVEILGRLLTDNYIHVNGGSGNIIRRSAWLNWLSSRKVELDSGKVKVTNYKLDVQNVVLTDKVGVVVGRAVSSGINNGESFSSSLRFSNTWICSDLGWRRASFHDSALE